MKGVVAAGHPLTAEAGAEVLREGGNAVDAAVAAVLASFAVESPLTGFGAGGFMMVSRGEETVSIDFFVAAPGKDGAQRGVELAPVPVHFDADTVQTFYVGPASCGVPGTAAGLEHALRRFGTAPLGDLARAAIRLAREGAPVNVEQAYILEILWPIHERLPEARALYAPDGRPLGEGDVFRFPELAEALERFATEGAEPFYRGDVAASLARHVTERGGTLGPTDLAEYEAIERRPVAAAFRGAEVLTNPPPSSGGILIAYALGLLERLGPESGPEQLVAAMDAANRARDEEFAEALYGEGLERALLDRERLDLRAGDLLAGDLLGSTTHVSVLDAEGMCASVTCSNGSGSGVLVPGTGVILNNMLGEEDLNPLGFHAIAPGRRVPSMMAPTVVRRDGEIVLGLGSAGSNRIRSAIVQTVVRAVEQGMPVGEAVRAPRLHFEQGIVQAEPGIDEGALARIEARGAPVLRRPRINLFFGGVQAVARDPSSGELSGGGDPRRGGSVATA
jgi:gamma-glutamyltranspeptidase / glutathione hydrolase